MVKTKKNLENATFKIEIRHLKSEAEFSDTFMIPTALFNGCFKIIINPMWLLRGGRTMQNFSYILVNKTAEIMLSNQMANSNLWCTEFYKFIYLTQDKQSSPLLLGT